MGFRLHKRIKLARGVAINLSRSGVSTSFGRPGAMLNVGRRGVRGTIGLPGTGISYSEKLSARPAEQSRARTSRVRALLWLLAVLIAVVALYVAFKS